MGCENQSSFPLPESVADIAFAFDVEERFFVPHGEARKLQDLEEGFAEMLEGTPCDPLHFRGGFFLSECDLEVFKGDFPVFFIDSVHSAP